MLLKMVDRQLHGVYHVLSPSTLSKYEFGVLIARQFGLDEGLITPTSWKDGGLQAARSPNLILKVDKLIRDLGIAPPTPDAGVRRFAEKWQDGYASRIRLMSQSV
jgi:dTDP-4-dehydrorhamnose reductase